MATYKEIKESMDAIVEHWGKDGEKVIEECFNIPYGAQTMPMNEFLSYCTACGGNWGGMLLTGIKKLYPNVWDAIPEKMGQYAFADLCCVLTLLHIEY